MKAAARILARMHVRARRPRRSVAREPMMLADIGDRHTESSAPDRYSWQSARRRLAPLSIHQASLRSPAGGAGRRRDEHLPLGRRGGQDCRGDDPPVRGDAVPTFTTSLVPARLPARCRPAQAVGRAPARSACATSCWRAGQRPRWRPGAADGAAARPGSIRRAVRSWSQPRHPALVVRLTLPGTVLAVTVIAALPALLADRTVRRWCSAGVRAMRPMALDGSGIPGVLAACRVHPLGWGLPPLGMGWAASFSRSTVVSTIVAGDGGDRHGTAISDHVIDG
jgi:hypothetical protein